MAAHEKRLARREIVEGRAHILIYPAQKISKKMEVFYNPLMRHNRDISVLLLKALKKKGMQVADPLAGSGVRSVRFLRELPAGMIKSVFINDGSEQAVRLIRENLKRNRVGNKALVSHEEANVALLQSSGFDYIDLDPFGSPNPFLDASVRRLSRTGILAVTATDTSSLCGTYPHTCRRKYWATPDHGPMMHEMGIRILIRKVQLIGAQYEKALVPVYCYAKDHYMRCFFQVTKGRTAAERLVSMHGMYGNAGPLWLGRLWDAALALEIAKSAQESSDDKALAGFLEMVAQEAQIDSVGFMDPMDICRRFKVMHVPRKEQILEAVRKKGDRIALTHFHEQSYRTTMPHDAFVRLFRDLGKRKRM